MTRKKQENYLRNMTKLVHRITYNNWEAGSCKHLNLVLER